ncbi:hypothetical protein E1B28_007939 [Marasmius oreades]|uniref:Uncharacterized protein n=1 Tax=Marasmius oreades TaxID=181124 RepID=A0A9P7UW13_9AGAR|nr:uncharacterized protein E1B28_007939 [Marasmius oreades]KAG7094339.1 hypothetical protein E1B28_007939 [Marasmius oreades]
MTGSLTSGYFLVTHCEDRRFRDDGWSTGRKAIAPPPSTPGSHRHHALGSKYYPPDFMERNMAVPILTEANTRWATELERLTKAF